MNYSVASGAVALVPDFTVTDSDGFSLAFTKISTSNHEQGLDLLNFVNTAKITGSFDTATGTLTLSGVDSLSNYRAAIRSVTYAYTGSSFGLKKTITIEASDGAVLSNRVSRDINLAR